MLEHRQNFMIQIEDNGLVPFADHHNFAAFSHLGHRQQRASNLGDLHRRVELTLQAAGSDHHDVDFALVG